MTEFLGFEQLLQQRSVQVPAKQEIKIHTPKEEEPISSDVIVVKKKLNTKHSDITEQEITYRFHHKKKLAFEDWIDYILYKTYAEGVSVEMYEVFKEQLMKSINKFYKLKKEENN